MKQTSTNCKKWLPLKTYTIRAKKNHRRQTYKRKLTKQTVLLHTRKRKRPPEWQSFVSVFSFKIQKAIAQVAASLPGVIEPMDGYKLI